MTNLPSRVGRCRWCDEPGRPLVHEHYPHGSTPVPVPVCATCYFEPVRGDHPANRRKRLWAMAYAQATRKGVRFRINWEDISDMPGVCPETGTPLEYRYPTNDRPEADDTAVLVPGYPKLGFVPGTGGVKVVCRRVAVYKFGVPPDPVPPPPPRLEADRHGPCRMAHCKRRQAYVVDHSADPPVVVPICKACYRYKVISAKADPDHRLWAWSYAASVRAGVPHTINIWDIKKPARCPVTGEGLFYGIPGPAEPEPGRYAVLVVVDPDGGYVPGNVRVLSADGAGVRAPTGFLPREEIAGDDGLHV